MKTPGMEVINPMIRKKKAMAETTRFVRQGKKKELRVESFRQSEERNQVRASYSRLSLFVIGFLEERRANSEYRELGTGNW